MKHKSAAAASLVGIALLILFFLSIGQLQQPHG